MIEISVSPVFASHVLNVIPTLSDHAIIATPELGQLVYRERAKFDGAYEYTPTAYEQTIEIGELVARQNIIIYPIPHNYGLITSSGAGIKIS